MYKYKEQREEIFNPDGRGIKKVLDIYDNIRNYRAALFTKVEMEDLTYKVGGSSWDKMACVDFLCEINKITEINKNSQTMSQHREFLI